MLTPIKRSAKANFSWLKIPDFTPSKGTSRALLNTIPQGPLLVLMHYYNAVSGFNLAPVLHKAFSQNARNPGISHAEVSREAWRPVWNDESSSFDVFTDQKQPDHTFWRWIGCLIFKNHRDLHKNVNSGVIGNSKLPSIPIFGYQNGNRFFSYKNGNSSLSIDPLELLLGPEHQDVHSQLLRIQWKCTKEFHEKYKQSPLEKNKDNQNSWGIDGAHLEARLDKRNLMSVIDDVRRLMNELSINYEAITKVVEFFRKQSDDNAVEAALVESATRLLESIEPMLTHTMFMAPGRFQNCASSKDLKTAFPVSVHVDISFRDIHKKEHVLFSMKPKDTPKVSKSNLSADEGLDENETTKKQNTGHYFNPSNGPRALTVPLIRWQEKVQNGYGYEWIFENGVVHDFKRWNELWGTLDGWYDLNGIKEGEDLTNIGFDDTLYFFAPEPQIDVLYKSYQLAIKTIQKRQGKIEGAIYNLEAEGLDLPPSVKSLLQTIVKAHPGKLEHGALGLDVAKMLKCNQVPPDISDHETMVRKYLFRETPNCLGMLKEQVLSPKGEHADHFGLNTHQRLFCRLAISSDPGAANDIAPLIALNGPPGTGKTTVLQAVVASEVVKSALHKTSMPIIMGASATHQAKSNIIGGFKYNEVHPDGSSSLGIWQRWIKGGEGESCRDYGLELSIQWTISNYLKDLYGNQKVLETHWDECFQHACDLPLESVSQSALRGRLIELFKEMIDPPYVPLHLDRSSVVLGGLSSLHVALEKWRDAARLHELATGRLIRNINESAIEFERDVNSLKTMWSSLDQTYRDVALQNLNKWQNEVGFICGDLNIEDPQPLIRLREEKGRAIQAHQECQGQKEIHEEASKRLLEERETWERKILEEWDCMVGDEWETIANIYNRIFRFCPSFLFKFVWALKERSIQDAVKQAVSKTRYKDSARNRQTVYLRKLVILKDRSQRAEPFEAPSIKFNEKSLRSSRVKEKESLNDRIEESRNNCLVFKEKEDDALDLVQIMTDQCDQMAFDHQKQVEAVKTIVLFFDEPRVLDPVKSVLLKIKNLSPPSSRDRRKAEVCLDFLNATTRNSLLASARLAIIDGETMQRSLLSITDDIANILGAWVDNAYKPTCFHLAARWHEGMAILELKSMKKPTFPPNQQELTKRLRLLARIYPVMVSTLHAIGRRMTIKEQEEDLLGIGIIDILVIDEAGQVSMDVGALSLLLTKRCLAVGDLDQLEPIWGIEPEDDVALFRTLTKTSRKSLPLADFSKMGWDCHASSMLALAQNHTPWSPYHDTLQRGLYLLEHNRCPIEIISYCDALSYKGQLRYKITSHYVEKSGGAKYMPLLMTDNNLWGGRLIDKMSIERCQNRELTLSEMASSPISLCHHESDDVMSGGSRSNEGEALEIIKWLDKKFAPLIKGRAPNDVDTPIFDKVAIITPFAPQARLIASLAKSFTWEESGLKGVEGVNLDEIFESDRKSKVDSGMNKTITIGTVHSLQGAEVDIVLFSNVYGKGSAGNKTFQDKNPQIMNVALSRAKQAFVVFANQHFVAGIKPGDNSALGLLLNQIRMIDQEEKGGKKENIS